MNKIKFNLSRLLKEFENVDFAQWGSKTLLNAAIKLRYVCQEILKQNYPQTAKVKQLNSFHRQIENELENRKVYFSDLEDLINIIKNR